MRIKFVMIIASALATLAVAQVSMVQGAAGEGGARSDDGRVGVFHFSVKKFFGAHGRTEVDGSLRFESDAHTTSHEPRHVVIEMHHAREFAKDKNVAEFAGPGVIHVRTSHGTVRHEGRVAVRVQDNRHPHDTKNPSTPDRFGIRFYVSTSNVFYQFAGNVLRGDLQVFERTR